MGEPRTPRVRSGAHTWGRKTPGWQCVAVQGSHPAWWFRGISQGLPSKLPFSPLQLEAVKTAHQTQASRFQLPLRTSADWAAPLASEQWVLGPLSVLHLVAASPVRRVSLLCTLWPVWVWMHGRWTRWPVTFTTTPGVFPLSGSKDAQDPPPAPCCSLGAATPPGAGSLCGEAAVRNPAWVSLSLGSSVGRARNVQLRLTCPA